MPKHVVDLYVINYIYIYIYICWSLCNKLYIYIYTHTHIYIYISTRVVLDSRYTPVCFTKTQRGWRTICQFIISLFWGFRCNELKQTHSCLRDRVCVCVRSVLVTVSLGRHGSSYPAETNERTLTLSIIMIRSEARYESKCHLGHFLNTTVFYIFVVIICQIFRCAKILTLSLDQWTSRCEIRLWSTSFRYLTQHGVVSKSIKRTPYEPRFVGICIKNVAENKTVYSI